MGFRRCPGSMAFAQPKIELVRCPFCSEDVEVWTDEAQGKCPKCGRAVCRTTTQSCIDWCKYAKECLGEDGHKKYQDMKTRLRKETLLTAAAKHLPDETALDLARARVEFAEQILRQETGADPNVVLASAALADVRGTPGGETGTAQAGAAELLQELGYPEGFVKEVAALLILLRERAAGQTVNFRVIHDADLLARMPPAAKSSPGARRQVDTTPFLTAAGRALAIQQASV